MSGTSRLPSGENPYRILGVTPEASDAEIARAYRRLVRQHHPDTAPGHTSLDQHRLGQILAAYHHLRRTRLAASHTPGTTVPVTVHHHPDTSGPTHPEPQYPAQSWLRPEPPSHGRSRSGRRRIQIAHRGIDTTAAVTITPEQADTGVVVTVAVPDNPVEGPGLRNIRVRIPPNTTDGETLRIPGQGSPGINGGPAGDLHLTVYHAALRTP